MSARPMLSRLRARTRARVAGRLPARGQDSGSMAMALLVGLIGSGIAAVLIPMVVVQIGSTSFDNSRTREMNAAEAGTLVAAGLIRSAINTTGEEQGQGDVTLLPCTSSPLTGTVDGTAGQLSYRVKIGYYTENPTDQSESWLATYTNNSGAGHGMICSQKAGTYLPKGALGSATAQQVPSWAVITSTGVDARGDRTLRSIYTVRTSNANIAGGTIYVWTADPTHAYCMDAHSPTPSAGDPVYIEPCATNPDGTPRLIQQQAWAYNSDLSIQLVSSITTDNPYGLCLSASQLDGTGKQQQVPQNIVLAQCKPVGSAPWSQIWSVDDSAHLRDSLTDKSDTGSACIDVAGQTASTRLTLQTCAGGTTDTRQTWVPSPDAGSGMAGVTSGGDASTPIQYVNFQQFSHCMDVTNQRASGGTDSDPGGNNFLIAYTCKQNPNPDNVAWNQKFKYVNGELITNNGSNYCLTSPLQTYDSAHTGAFVTVTSCPASPTSETTWRKFDKNADPVSGSPSGGTGYKFAIQDSNGYCLSMTTDSSAAYEGYPKLIVATCDGSKLQMWNGTPDTQTPTLTDFSEVEVEVSP